MMTFARFAGGFAACLLACTSALPANAQADPAAQARAAAEAIDTSGQPEAAEAAWREVIALEEALPEPRLDVLVTARSRIGDSLYYRGRPKLAQQLYEEAIALIESAGEAESDLMSETLANLGTMLSAQGRPLEDIEIQRRALAIRTRLHGADDPRLATNYFNLGNALHEAGRGGEAAEAIERGARMRLTTMAPENPDLFLSLTTAAGIIEAAGRVETGIELAQKALTLMSTHHPGHPFSGFTRGMLGKTLVAAGRAAEAVPVLRTAIDELEPVMGREHGLTLNAIANLSVAQARLGRFAEAKELMLRSRPSQGETPGDKVRTLVSASNYAAEADDQDEALRLAEESHRAGQELAPENALRAMAAYTLAMHLERQGDYGRALPLMQQARDGLALQEDPDSPRMLAYEIYLGGLEIRGANAEAGFARVAAAAERLAPMMFGVAESPDLGELNNSYYEAFARAAEAAVDAEQPQDAFRYYQLAAHNSVARASRQVAMRNLAGDASDRLRAIQDSQRRLRLATAARTRHLAAGDVAQADNAAVAISALEAEIAAMRMELSRIAPQVADLTTDEPVPIEELQARLEEGEAVYVALPSRMRTTVMLVTHGEARALTVPRSRGQIRPIIAALRSSIGSAGAAASLPGFDLNTAHALHALLFPEALGAASGIRRLHVAATDALAQLPFDLLVTRKPDAGTQLADAAWLIRDMAIEVPVTLASVGLPDGEGPVRGTFAGIGAPALAGPADRPIQLAALYRDGSADVQAVRELPLLPAAEQELVRMSQALAENGEAPLITGAAATEAAVKAMDLSRYDVIAFATHGLLADEIDGLAEPALVLTPPETPSEADDGLLSASEIADLKLDAALVILSACNTAAGSTQGAPAYTGLAQAFIYAGAKSLLLSHWRVRDDAAARLSVATIEGTARGLGPAEALRQAKLDMIGDTSVPDGAHPAVWAPFVLIDG